MKSRSLQQLGLLATLGAGAAVAATDGVLHMGIQRRSAADGRPIVRRASSGSVTEALTNDPSDGLYLAEVQVGTPPQTVKLQLDTGSSDTWVVYTGSSICEQGGCTGGSFDPSKSSSFDDLDKGAFQIAYADKTSATGDYFNDIFTIGGVTLQNLTMGVGLKTDIPFGLVGVGFPNNEAGVASGNIKAYPNLPVQLVKEKVINTVAFSLWLNDLDSNTGSILFGGVDTAKFTGPLTRLKLYPTADQSTINEFAVALTSVTAVSKSGTDKLGSASFPAAVVLDSGTTHSFLPSDLVAQMYKEANVQVDNDIPNVPCSYAASSAYFSFGFGGPQGAVVNVSMSELVLEVVGNYTTGANKGKDACRFGIDAVQDGGSLVLGDTFLRSAFVVYDLMNNEAALAQTKFNVSDSNVVAFASLSATVPSGTPAPSQSNIAQGVVSATPTSYAAAASFTAASGASGRVGGGAGLPGVTLAAMLSLAVGFVGFLAL